MNEKVAMEPLPPRRRDTWAPEAAALHHPMVVTRTWSRWRCARGYRIHRARFAQIYRDGWMSLTNKKEARLVVQFYCGQVGHDPIPFREECSEGTSPCGKCDGLFAMKVSSPEVGE